MSIDRSGHSWLGDSPADLEEYAFFAGEEEVRWVYGSARCLTDGTLGVYTDWKIDYSPSAQLLSQA